MILELIQRQAILRCRLSELWLVFKKRMNNPGILAQRAICLLTVKQKQDTIALQNYTFFLPAFEDCGFTVYLLDGGLSCIHIFLKVAMV